MKEYSRNDFKNYLFDKVKGYKDESKLNLCKYDLVFYGMDVKTVVTETLNREYVLVELIKKAMEFRPFRTKYKIYLTEDGIKSVFLDSKIDKQFINFLYEGDR